MKAFIENPHKLSTIQAFPCCTLSYLLRDVVNKPFTNAYSCINWAL